MIDSREYETTEDLAAAMQLEADIAKLDATKKAIETVKIYIKSLWSTLDFLEEDKERYQKRIDDYWKGVHERGKNYKRYENRSQLYDAGHH